MTTVILAFDRLSVRSIDADGRLHIAKSHISKAGVNPYRGSEIPGWKELGLDSEKIYRMFRDPVELERGMQTFARLPIQSKHVHTTVDDPRPDLVVGAIGSEVSFELPYLDADLCIWDSTAIAGIETGEVQELSCAYRYVPVMDSGEYEGQPYDGRMTEIKGSHLAVVPIGRAGDDVLVADSNPFEKEVKMKMTKLGKALHSTMLAISPVLAADSALPSVFANMTKKNFKKTEVKAKLIAMDASLDSNKLDAVLDAILDQDPNPVETPAAAADESPAEKVKKMLSGKVDDKVIEEICAMMSKPAEDEDKEEKDKKEDKDKKKVAEDDDDMDDDTAMDKDEGMKPAEVKAAMDGLRAELREAEQARRDVRPVVGDVIGMDSAELVYGFALDHLKIDRKDVRGVPALRALFKVASSISTSTSPKIAQDAGGLEKLFPSVARFK